MRRMGLHDVNLASDKVGLPLAIPHAATINVIECVLDVIALPRIHHAHTIRELASLCRKHPFLQARGQLIVFGRYGHRRLAVITPRLPIFPTQGFLGPILPRRSSAERPDYVIERRTGV